MDRKILVGMVTFGNLPFSKLTVSSIKETSTYPVDFFVVIGKPGDVATEQWLIEDNIPYKKHDENYGFPFSINDIYDFAWNQNDYDYVIIVGNDIVAYPYCMDSMISLADYTDYEVISASQVDVRAFVEKFPHRAVHFMGGDYKFTNFESKCWEDFKDYSPDYQIAHMQLLDIQNCCLYKRSVFDKVGYTDVNFYPAYYIDNDYARRIVRANIKCCSLGNAKFFHFWSRTIKQETGGSTNKFFENNRRYYINKWGGDFGAETLEPPICINTRINELSVINYWKNL